MRRILLIDLQSFFWSYLKIRHQLMKYDFIIFVYSKEHFTSLHSLGFFIKGLVKLDSSCKTDFYEISGREDNIPLNAKMISMANELADRFNPMDDIFHLMCHQFPENLIQHTLEDNGYYFSSLQSSQIYLNLDDEVEAVQFLKTCQTKNVQHLPIREPVQHELNESISEKENEQLLDVELLSLSVIDFVREDFRFFKKRKSWRKTG